MTDEIGAVADDIVLDIDKEPVEVSHAVAKSRNWGTLWRFLLLVLVALAVVWAGVGMHGFVAGAFAIHYLYGWSAAALLVLLGLLIVTLLIREVYGYLRLGRFRRLREVVADLEAHPRDSRLNAEVRRELRQFLQKMDTSGDGAIRCDIREIRKKFDLAEDAHEWKRHVETLLLERLDREADKCIKQEALWVGAGTAGSPRGFLDGLITLWRNITLVRKIAHVYRVRTGFYGTLVLIKRSFFSAAMAVLAQESASLVVRNLGFSVLRVISPLFQGVTNAALTMHVGLETQQLCRPLALPEDKKRTVRKQTLKYIGDGLKSVLPRFAGVSRA